MGLFSLKNQRRFVMRFRRFVRRKWPKALFSRTNMRKIAQRSLILKENEPKTQVNMASRFLKRYLGRTMGVPFPSRASQRS
jgi:hypothetical protein